MANWAWPHTPASNLARVLLVGGPFSGQEIGFLPPDTAAPAQIVWAGWFNGGFTAYLYEWHGETRVDRGRADTIVYTRSTPYRRLTADEIPPVIADAADLWSEGAELIVNAFDVPAEMMWPGV